MPTGPKGEKRPADVIGNAVKVMRIATEEELENFDSAKPAPTTTAEAGKLGAAVRASNLTPERRAEIARTAAAKRWSKD